MIVRPATFAEYMATCSGDKSTVVAHYAEQERQAAEEAQQAKDAALWRRFAEDHPHAAKYWASKWATEQ